MPEKQNTFLFAPHEPRTIDDIGFPVQDGLKKLRIFSGVVLQVGVLDQNDIARCRGEAGAQGGSLALVHRMIHHPKSIAFEIPLQDLRGPIARAIIYDDDLLLHSA